MLTDVVSMHTLLDSFFEAFVPLYAVHWKVRLLVAPMLAVETAVKSRAASQALVFDSRVDSPAESM